MSRADDACKAKTRKIVEEALGHPIPDTWTIPYTFRYMAEQLMGLKKEASPFILVHREMLIAEERLPSGRTWHRCLLCKEQWLYHETHAQHCQLFNPKGYRK